MVELTTQLLIPSNVLWLPLCRIYKFGLNTLPSKTVVIPILVGYQDLFLLLLPGSIAIFVESLRICRVLGETYAKGWLIMVGASRTSPVPGSGMRRRHERRHTLPRFGALLGDNTPSPALWGLLMITKALVSTMVLLELYARGRRRQG